MSKNSSFPKQTDAPSPNEPGGPGTPLTGPDLLLQGGAAWDKYKLPIIAGVVLLVLALVGSELYRGSRQRSAEAATAALDGSKTIGEYRSVIDTYPGTLAAGDAYLLMAHEQIDAKDYAGAATTWQTFAEKYPKHPQVATALLARGNALEAEGKLDEARSIYQNVATGYPSDYAAPLARMSEATLLKSQHKLEDARHVYENVIASYPNSIAKLQAEQELRFLNALPPAGAPPPTPVPSPIPAASVAPTPAVAPGSAASPAASVSPTPAPVASPAVSPAASVIPPAQSQVSPKP